MHVDAELAEFLHLAGVEAGSADSAVVDIVEAAGGAFDAHGEVAEAEDFAALEDVASARFQWKSAKHIEHARKARERKLDNAKKEKELNKRRRVENTLAIVSASSRSTIGIRQCGIAPATHEVRAQLLLHLACSPRIHSSMFEAKRKQQSRAVMKVAELLRTGRDAHWNRLVSGHAAGGQAAARCLMFACQWDETAQRFRQVREKQVNGERLVRARLSAQVMVFNASMVDMNISAPGLSIHPFFANTLMVHATDSNTIMEALLQQFPFKLEDEEHMVAVASAADTFVFACTMDRASSNLACARFFARVCASHPRTILPWAELCAAHGVALVKTKAAMVKSLSSSLCAFTLWTKFAKNIEALEKELRVQVCQSFEVRRCPPSDGFMKPGLQLVDAIWGGRASQALRRWNEKKACYQSTPFCDDLMALCKVCSFDQSGPMWVHFCYTTEEHAADGTPVGSPCCSTRQEAIDKCWVPLKNLVTGRAWAEAKMARWTNVGSAIRRFALLCAAGNILINALKQVKAQSGVADTLEGRLARAIAADMNDFHSKNQLRLLRIVKSLSLPQTLQNISLCLIAFGVMDTFLFAILGGPEQPRLTLSAMVHPRTSPITTAQTSLAELLFTFGSSAGIGGGDDPELERTPSWLPYEVLSGSWDDPAIRLEARRTILQLAAGIVDIFEMRMEKPPYRQMWLIFADTEVDQVDKAAVVESLFEEPEECLPLLSCRLKELFPGKEHFKTASVPTLRMLGDGTFISIDFSERAHAQFRHDVASPTSGANYDATSSKLLVRQCATAHKAAGGVDPASKTARSLMQEAGLLEQPHAHRATPAHIAYGNHRRQAFKALLAPDRKLTRAERQTIDANISDGWQQARQDPAHFNAWKEKGRLKPALCDGDRDGGAVGAPFKSPCGLSTDPRSLVDLDKVVAEVFLHDTEMEDAHAGSGPPRSNATNMFAVRKDVPDRHSMLPKNGRDWMFGCYQQKKNVCREHSVPAEELDAFDRIVNMMKGYVRALTPEQKTAASQLVGFVSPATDGRAAIIVVELLVALRQQPGSIQFWADCCSSNSHARALQHPLVYPEAVEIMARASRLALPSDRRRAIAISTSDELGRFLQRLSGNWRMVRLEYNIDTEHRGLHKMIVTGEEELVIAAPRVRTRNRCGPLPAEFYMGDPAELGRMEAAGSMPAASDEPAPAPGAVEDGVDSCSESSASSGLGFAGLDVVEREDLEDLIAMERELPPPVFGPECPDGDGPLDVLVAIEEPAGPGDPYTFEAGPDVPMRLPDELIDIERARREAAAAAAHAADNATVDDAGGPVTCTVEPWNWYYQCGTLQVFPPGAAPDAQKVVMRCGFHTGCSQLRRRQRATNRQMLEWLFHGKPYLPGGPNADVLQAQHQADAIRLLP